jgi:hypothetical protein
LRPHRPPKYRQHRPLLPLKSLRLRRRLSRLRLPLPLILPRQPK